MPRSQTAAHTPKKISGPVGAEDGTISGVEAGLSSDMMGAGETVPAVGAVVSMAAPVKERRTVVVSVMT